jgi:hypothetical protein
MYPYVYVGRHGLEIHIYLHIYTYEKKNGPPVREEEHAPAVALVGEPVGVVHEWDWLIGWTLIYEICVYIY